MIIAQFTFAGRACRAAAQVGGVEAAAGGDGVARRLGERAPRAHQHAADGEGQLARSAGSSSAMSALSSQFDRAGFVDK